MNFFRELTSDEQVVYKSLFRGDKSNYVPEEINGKSANSCDYHAMTHAHTEILGVFCDNTATLYQELREILTIGLSEWRKRWIVCGAVAICGLYTNNLEAVAMLALPFIMYMTRVR